MYYKFFDADFWKYRIYAEWTKHTLCTPSLTLRIDLKRQAPFIELIVYFFRWMIIISYSENAIAGFRITEDDWGIIPDFIDGFKMAKISLNHWWGLMQKSGDVRFYRSWFFDSLK